MIQILKNPIPSLDCAILTIPYRDYTKTQLIGRYLKEGGSVSALLKTRSCYSSEEGECGKCRSCVRKYTALKLNGQESLWINDPLNYIEESFNYAVKNNRKAEINDLKRLMTLFNL